MPSLQMLRAPHGLPAQSSTLISQNCPLNPDGKGKEVFLFFELTARSPCDYLATHMRNRVVFKSALMMRIKPFAEALAAFDKAIVLCSKL